MCDVGFYCCFSCVVVDFFHHFVLPVFFVGGLVTRLLSRVKVVYFDTGMDLKYRCRLGLFEDIYLNG